MRAAMLALLAVAAMAAAPAAPEGSYCGKTANAVMGIRFDFPTGGGPNCTVTVTDFGTVFDPCTKVPFHTAAGGRAGETAIVFPQMVPKLNDPSATTSCISTLLVQMWITDFRLTWSPAAAAMTFAAGAQALQMTRCTN
jgi:hypothetical protein